MNLKPEVTRDELQELLGVKAVTFYSWWQQGYMAPPSNPGGKAEQASFSLEEALNISVFSRVVRDGGRKLREAAVVARYLQSRPGWMDIIREKWESPVTLVVYPVYDLAAFNFPKHLFKDHLHKAVHECVEAEKIRKPASLTAKFWYDLYSAVEVSSIKLKGLESKDIGLLVEQIFRSYKSFQYASGDTEEFTVLLGSTLAAPPRLALIDRLLAESWAMANIRSGLTISAWHNRFLESHAEAFSVRVDTQAFFQLMIDASKNK